MSRYRPAHTCCASSGRSHLLRYGEDRNPEDFAFYLAAIAIPLGDQRARLELDRGKPDLERVREGLLAGGNHPDDIPRRVRLYRNFRHIHEVDAAIRVWAAGDEEIAALHEQALALRRLVERPGCDDDCVAPVLRRIAQIDSRLTPLERAFSEHLGQASRRVTRLLTTGSAVVATLLLMSAILLSHGPLRRERRLREALSQREEQLQLAVEGSNDGLWDWHLGSGELHFSARCAQMLGYGASELPHARETVLGLLHPSDLEAFEAKLARHLRSGEPYDRRVPAAQARRRLPVGARTRPAGAPRRAAARAHGGLADGYLGQQALRGAVVCGKGAGPGRAAGNRRRGGDHRRMGPRAVAHAQGVSHTLMYLDLDQFKVVNDTCGHAAGDELIRQMAEVMGSQLRRSDTLAICFEITETAAIANLAQAGSFIQQLQQLGCSFALDDFGAGMSSFAYLKHLPAAYLKIDGSFVREMLADPVNLVMVEVIQRIGHAMGKKTIAEFVESEAMLGRLRELGVDLVQGFHIGPPQPFAPSGLAAMEPSAAARMA
nr:EAL domain-containing protein [Cupriavidus oxalaticus]